MNQFQSSETTKLRRVLDVKVSLDGLKAGSGNLRDFPGFHFECLW